MKNEIQHLILRTTNIKPVKPRWWGQGGRKLFASLERQKNIPPSLDKLIFNRFQNSSPSVVIFVSVSKLQNRTNVVQTKRKLTLSRVGIFSIFSIGEVKKLFEIKEDISVVENYHKKCKGNLKNRPLFLILAEFSFFNRFLICLRYPAIKLFYSCFSDSFLNDDGMSPFTLSFVLPNRKNNEIPPCLKEETQR